MLRKIIILLLIVVGIVCIASGVWGLSLQHNGEVDPALLGAAETVLDYAGNALDTMDSTVSDWTDSRLNVTDILNSLVGDAVDLTDKSSMTRFAFLYATELLLGGIICVQTGLLIRKYKLRQ